MRFDPNDRIKSVCDLLKGESFEIYSNSDEEYDYLEDGDHCICVGNHTDERGGSDLYLDLEQDGVTLTLGDWDAHYEATEADFRLMLRELSGLLHNRIFLAMIYQKKKWLCSFTVEEAEDGPAGKEKLKRLTLDFLNSADRADLAEAVKKGGCQAHCRYWDNSRNRRVEI